MATPPPTSLLERLWRFLDNQKVRYLLAGGWNTVFGYGAFASLYFLFHRHCNYLILAVIANILAITMAYATYKCIVFRTKGNILREYLRFYGVYGANALVGLALLSIFVDLFHLSPYLAPLLTTFITVVISYFGHKHFSFKHRKPSASSGGTPEP